MAKILAVDDSSSMRQMVTFTLKSQNYDVVQAEDGLSALKIAQSNKVDLILTDLNMPVMDGLALIKELRALPQYKTVPIIMLTTESSDKKKQEGKQAGATGWIVKPFDPEKLLNTLKRVLG